MYVTLQFFLYSVRTNCGKIYVELENNICENLPGLCVKIQLNCSEMTVTSLSSFALLGLVVGLCRLIILSGLKN